MPEARLASSVFHALESADRELALANKRAEQAKTRYREALADALAVFEANDWPPAVRDGNDMTFWLIGHADVDIVRKHDIPTVYSLKAANSPAEAPASCTVSDPLTESGVTA